jgi:nicotinamide-nucleotide amidase
VAVVTGGLGPTEDDLTAEVAAAAAGVPLVFDPAALAQVEAFFKRRNREMTYSNRKQAMFPEGAVRLDNPVGTAPGFMLKIGRCSFFCLPGVPVEMKRMLADHVLPACARLQGSDRAVLRVRTVSTFGYGESVAGEMLAGFDDAFPDLKLGFRAKFPEVQIKIYGHHREEAPLEARMGEALEWILSRVGEKTFSARGDSMQKVVGDLLREKGATLAIAESCTGGLISDWVTDVPGSSDYFVFSAVAYANRVKEKILGVSAETLETYGAVHEQTAREMARGVRRIAGATYGLATTGIAGPGGGTAEKPVGTVCIGLATPEGEQSRRYFFPFPTRLMNKQIFAMTALNMLRRELAGK